MSNPYFEFHKEEIDGKCFLCEHKKYLSGPSVHENLLNAEAHSVSSARLAT